MLTKSIILGMLSCNATPEWWGLYEALVEWSIIAYTSM